jgi:hypothetical protein
MLFRFFKNMREFQKNIITGFVIGKNVIEGSIEKLVKSFFT